MLRSFMTVSGLTCLSKTLGYIRDMLIAHTLGASFVSDAFFVALKLPNLFRRLFGEGAFNSAFVPIFSRILKKDTHETALFFLRNVYSLLALVLFALVLLFEIFMPQYLYVYVHGYTDHPERFQLVVEYSRIMFPYIFFIALAALLGGVLNTLNQFAAATFAPILLNIVAIITLCGTYVSPSHAGEALSWATLVAGILQLWWVHSAIRWQSFAIVPVFPVISPPTKELFLKMGPGVVGAGLYQFNLFVTDCVASYLPIGTISAISFADRINQFPLSIIGIAMGTILLPTLSRHFQNQTLDKAHETQLRAINFALFLSIPAACGLFMLAHPAVQTLFERGCFQAEATTLTASILAFFALGLPAYILSKVLTTTFFAEGNTLTPVKVSGIAILSNLLLNLFFVFRLNLGPASIALGTAASAWINIALLGFLLHRRGRLSLDKRLWSSLGRTILASVAMLAVLAWAPQLINPILPHCAFFEILKLGILLGLGLATFFAVSLLLCNNQLKAFREIAYD